MHVTEQGAASNAVELGASDTRDMVRPKPTKPNAFGARVVAYAGRAMVRGRSDTRTADRAWPVTLSLFRDRSSDELAFGNSNGGSGSTSSPRIAGCPALVFAARAMTALGLPTS